MHNLNPKGAEIWHVIWYLLCWNTDIPAYQFSQIFTVITGLLRLSREFTAGRRVKAASTRTLWSEFLSQINFGSGIWNNSGEAIVAIDHCFIFYPVLWKIIWCTCSGHRCTYMISSIYFPPRPLGQIAHPWPTVCHLSHLLPLARATVGGWFIKTSQGLSRISMQIQRSWEIFQEPGWSHTAH